ncbi:MAG: hypothetical protein KKC79_19885 [Gammaproteobacteria bacterium]|nr:hypothetical protein [Gammaproteobacteria bacterium]MBU1443286.1 hypothetical protein [Gammaproteobacteria bacterium]MBU2285095.1 hypothetical protein [Gammaproteobacteria bacterium]MBU2410897.1 hypothetical protein [Gammaproteobacteria bacterium]
MYEITTVPSLPNPLRAPSVWRKPQPAAEFDVLSGKQFVGVAKKISLAL